MHHANKIPKIKDIRIYFSFLGYVLIVLEEGLDLSDVNKYGPKKNNGALEVMLRRYNRLWM